MDLPRQLKEIHLKVSDLFAPEIGESGSRCCARDLSDHPPSWKSSIGIQIEEFRQRLDFHFPRTGIHIDMNMCIYVYILTVRSALCVLCITSNNIESTYPAFLRNDFSI